MTDNITTNNPRRARFLRTLRKAHGWLGLGGALMGLAFGVTGIFLNHRSILKLPVTMMEKSSVELSVPASAAITPEALASWLQAEHAVPARNAPGIKVEKPQTVLFDAREVLLPARWVLNFGELKRQYSAEHWVGSGTVKLEKQDATVLGTLTRLHKGSGTNALWVLLVDAFAGALILLSLSGLMLWTRLEWPRAAGLTVGLAAPVLAVLWFIRYGL